MKKFFTLIELIVVIAVLGILAAIIIPNISNFQEEANDTAIVSNVRNLQTSVDMYGLENFGATPTSDIPLEDVPQPIDFNKIYPDYTRDVPETEGVKYWVDFQGKVWASTIDSPSDVAYIPGELKWTGVENAAYYNVFKLVDNNASSSIKNKKTIFVKKLEDSNPNVTDTTLPNLQAGEQYLVSAIDKNGFESAPVGTNYNGYVEVPFTGGSISKESENNVVLSVPNGLVASFDIENTSLVNKINNKSYSLNGVSVVDSRVGKGMLFNGQQISIPLNDLNIDSNTQAVSVSFWLKERTNASAYMPIGFYLYDYYCVSGYCGYNTGNSDVYGINDPYNNSYKHTVIIFKKGDTTQGEIYINGIKQSTSQKLNSQSSNYAVFSSNLNISGWGGSGYRMSDIEIDEVQVWNRELTDEEVTQVYNQY